jgi:hypothetical protein
MAESVYKVVELVGTSDVSWERAAAAAVERAGESLRDLRIAQVLEQDLQIDNGKVVAYRTKLKVSFKYEGGG